MKVPISIEDLIKKRKDDENDSKKIVFLSKEERTRIALEKRAQAVQETKKVIESGRPKTTDFFSSLASNDTSAPMDTNKKRDSFDSQRRDSRKNNDRWGKAKDYENDTKQYTEKDSNTELKQDVQLKDQELQYIRDRYVGGKPAKKRLRKMNDQKFVFDWDAQEDTSQDINPLYQEKHSAQLFGRGHIAGIDPTEQKKNAERFYKDVSSLQKDHDAHPIKRESTRKSTFDD
ncbi:DEAD (Asp-Glu-Ala-Asp) box polypeptide 23, partial [Globomyces sp. JEL0801]